MKERIDEITSHLASVRLSDEADFSHHYWQIWQASNYVAYPFAGGAMQQPQWLLDDYAIFDLLQERASLELEYEAMMQTLHEQAKSEFLGK